VQAAVERYRKRRYNAVVLYVRVANYESIRSLHGTAVAEQSMIRAAMRLRRVAPDADCLGRVGDTTIGVIFESATSRQSIMETASRFVAQGLMPLEGLRPQVLLNFHVVANSLAENAMDAGELETTLNQILASMSPRTHRPIRFLDPGARDTLPVAIEVDDDEADAGTVAA
jgi:two-component system, sensor histidine kinase LadS